ncbi:MAG TPA: zinc-dependent metalloprotease [Acidimicrobiales bacterium]|nr:zinc-dependent metalloprotease [Acidimicrobiales bacterium]
MAETAVDWGLAERVAVRAAGSDPFFRSYHADSLAADFDELTARAEEQVAAATGLHSLAGPARARVDDRAAWIRANIASFQRLLRPVTNRLEETVGSGLLAPVARRAAGAEVGALLGWMSTRVLGQYDLLVIEDEDPHDQDLVHYVGTNVLALEKKFGFPPREFRHWLALHEVTHRMQFTGIPWMREHFLGLVDGMVSVVDDDPKELLAAVTRAVDEIRKGRNPLDEGGIAALVGTPAQRELLEHIGGLMSLLEGHGDVTMDRAGADQIPNADRFGQVLRQRRQQANPIVKLVQKLIGFEAKLKQYEQGERFIEAVEKAGGPAQLDRAWEDAANLPTMTEIRDPQAWLDRVGVAAPAA